MKAGMAAGRIFTRGDHRHRVVIGKDTRLSGYMIESALVSGFTAVGMDVFQFGPLPTPAVAMLTRSLARRSGRDDHRLAQSLSGQWHQILRSRRPEAVRRGGNGDRAADGWRPGSRAWRTGTSIGRAKRVDDSQARYIEFAKRTFPRNLRLDGLRIVIDCANGAAYKVAPEVLWELGADIVTIGRVAGRPQHQSGLRLDRAPGDVRQGARSARRFRHRAGRRCRPGGDGRRKGPASSTATRSWP